MARERPGRTADQASRTQLTERAGDRLAAAEPELGGDIAAGGETVSGLVHP
jgi:hypothetical protein